MATGFPGGRNSFPEEEQRPRILLAEDDADMRDLLSFVLWREGYAVDAMSDGISLLQRLDQVTESDTQDWDLIISDIRMPGITGLEVLEYLHARGELPPLVLMTAFGDEQTHHYAQQLGAAAVIDKPFDLRTIQDQIKRLLPVPGFSI